MRSSQVGVWLSLARALRSGRRGRRFKSSHPDHFFLFSTIQSFMAGFFCILILPKVSPAFTANHRSGREQTENANFSEKACVLHRFSRNSLFGKVGGRL